MTLRERGRGVLSCRVCTRCWQSVVQAWHRHATAVVRWTAGGLLPTLIVSGAVAASYHPVAHGGQRAFLASIILTALATLFAAAIVAWQLGAVAWTLAAAGVILVAGHALHMVRLTQAPAAGVPIAQVREEFQHPDVAEHWQFVAEDGAEVSVQGGRLVIRTPPGAKAFVTMPLPPRPAALLLPRPRWWQLMGLRRPAVIEELAWTARLQLDNQFFVVAVIDGLLVQGTPYGLHLTVPQADGSVLGREVRQVSVAAGLDHTWRLIRSGDWVALEIDEREVWRGLARGPFREIRFGETQTDRLHGGALSIEHVEYRLAWDNR